MVIVFFYMEIGMLDVEEYLTAAEVKCIHLAARDQCICNAQPRASHHTSCPNFLSHCEQLYHRARLSKTNSKDPTWDKIFLKDKTFGFLWFSEMM